MWNDLAPIVQSFLTLTGSSIASNANRNAAAMATNAALQGAAVTSDAITHAAQIEADALVKAGGYAREGIQQANETLTSIRQQGAPGVSYLRQVVAEPGELTPAQRTQLDELRRSVGNTIRGSNFAGSGRTAAKLFKKAETDFTNTALDSNRARADAAATTLTNQSTNAATGVATNATNLGNTLANLAAKSGQVSGNAVTSGGVLTGDALTRGGLYGAQAEIAGGSLTGKAMGDVASMIANQQRESRYADRLSKIEKSLGIGA